MQYLLSNYSFMNSNLRCHLSSLEQEIILKRIESLEIPVNSKPLMI